MILFRDPGPDGLAGFFDGRTALGRPGAEVWLHDAEAPTPCSLEFGELVLFGDAGARPAPEPHAWIAPAGASAPAGFVPPDADRRAIAAARPTEERALRQLLPGYEEAKRAAEGRLRAYFEERAEIEALAAPIRARYEELRDDLARAGLAEAELFGPWFQVDPLRRREIRGILGQFPA